MQENRRTGDMQPVAVSYSLIAKLIGRSTAEIPVATSAVDRILAAKFSPTEKIILISLCRRPPDLDVTAAELATDASVHRITVVKVLTRLRARGLLRRVARQRWAIEWTAMKGEAPCGPPANDWQAHNEICQAVGRFTPRGTRRNASTTNSPLPV
jgi:hypothetical protein